ncbi:MAG: hypothetical protein CM1200mP2_29880 [Planctomycetaceae bacterium]|nr:MAG: hypothetical protein CM1200mP2_29880 [Planctomycetaceae bacterium]
MLKQEAMGFGDVTLMAAIGSFLGWQQALTIFFIAPLFGVVFALANWFLRRERELPYGPFLAIGTLFFLYAFKHLWPNLEATFGWGPFFVVMLFAGGAMFIPLLRLARLSVGCWASRTHPPLTACCGGPPTSCTTVPVNRSTASRDVGGPTARPNGPVRTPGGGSDTNPTGDRGTASHAAGPRVSHRVTASAPGVVRYNRGHDHDRRLRHGQPPQRAKGV